MDENIQTNVITEESKKMIVINDLLSMYMSRYKEIDNDNIIQKDTYNTRIKEDIFDTLTNLLITDISEAKANVINSMLNTEIFVTKDITVKDEHGEDKIHTIQVPISAFTGTNRYKLTEALAEYKINQALNI